MSFEHGPLMVFGRNLVASSWSSLLGDRDQFVLCRQVVSVGLGVGEGVRAVRQVLPGETDRAIQFNFSSTTYPEFVLFPPTSALPEVL